MGCFDQLMCKPAWVLPSRCDLFKCIWYLLLACC